MEAYASYMTSEISKCLFPRKRAWGGRGELSIMPKEDEFLSDRSAEKHNFEQLFLF